MAESETPDQERSDLDFDLDFDLGDLEFDDPPAAEKPQADVLSRDIESLIESDPPDPAAAATPEPEPEPDFEPEPEPAPEPVLEPELDEPEIEGEDEEPEGSPEPEPIPESELDDDLDADEEPPATEGDDFGELEDDEFEVEEADSDIEDAPGAEEETEVPTPEPPAIEEEELPDTDPGPELEGISEAAQAAALRRKQRREAQAQSAREEEPAEPSFEDDELVVMFDDDAGEFDDEIVPALEEDDADTGQVESAGVPEIDEAIDTEADVPELDELEELDEFEELQTVEEPEVGGGEILDEVDAIEAEEPPGADLDVDEELEQLTARLEQGEAIPAEATLDDVDEPEETEEPQPAVTDDLAEDDELVVDLDNALDDLGGLDDLDDLSVADAEDEATDQVADDLGDVDDFDDLDDLGEIDDLSGLPEIVPDDSSPPQDAIEDAASEAEDNRPIADEPDAEMATGEKDDDAEDEFDAEIEDGPTEGDEGRRSPLSFGPAELAGLAAVLVACAVALFALSSTVSGVLKIAREGIEEIDDKVPSKIEGELVTINDISCYWRDRVAGDRTDKDSVILPVVELANPEGKGILQVLFRDSTGEIRGDGHSFAIAGGKFGGSETSVTALCTEGLQNEVQFRYYRSNASTAKEDRWNVRIRESVDGSEWNDIALFEIPAVRKNGGE